MDRTMNLGGALPQERCLVPEDAAYPEKLRCLTKIPKRLYVRGELPDASKPAVAVIGARKCSSYGQEMAGYFARELAGAGIQIISGMAAGVDGIAQSAAIKAGGKSYAVLGCGTDICYPKTNQGLYEKLLYNGGIISEYPAGTAPQAFHFPIRNRIISALSDAILVIEAKQKSGTLITVDFALEQGKDVYALPGRLTDELSGGCNQLLFQGAGLALEPKQLIEILYARNKNEMMHRSGVMRDTMRAERKKTMRGTGQSKTDCGTDCYRLDNGQVLEPEMNQVIRQMSKRPIMLQELLERLQEKEAEDDWNVPHLTDILMKLLLEGLIMQDISGGYRRK